MKALYEDRELAALAAEKIKIFAQPQRLMILSCLLRGERNVGDIAEATGLVQPALSQQLGELRRAELVQTRKEAKQVWYALADADVAACVRTIEAIFGGIGEIPAAGVSPVGGPPVGAPAASFPEGPRNGVAAFARIL